MTNPPNSMDASNIPSAQHLRQSTLEMLSSTDNLPTLPDLFLRIQKVLNDSDSSLQDLTLAIEADQITAATIVKIANSSYYNPLGKPASSLSFAISRLGRDETSSIALSISLLYGFSIPAGMATIRRFWVHAFAVGQTCRKIAAFAPAHHAIDVDALFLAGLLHDIGRAILGIRIDTHYFEQPFSCANGDELIAAEDATYGVHHAEVGSIVMQQWAMTEDVCHLIQHHHDNNHISVSGRILAQADLLAHQHLTNITSIEDAELIIKDKSFDTIVSNLLDSEDNPFGDQQPQKSV